MRRHLRHASSGTRGAKPAPLATEGHQQLVVAGVTAQAEKAMGEDATPQIVVKFTFHIGRQACGIGVVSARGEKGLQVLRDHGVEHRAGWDPGVRRWQPLAPYEPPQTAGRGWKCQELPSTILLICSVYKQNITSGYGGNTRDAPLCLLRTLRCPRGGGKIAFEILIHTR